MSTTGVSADLGAILDMAARLEARAVDLAAAEIPGGDATVNLGPVADMTTWERRNDLTGDALAPFEDPDDLWPPYQTLRYWSEQWRTDLGMDHDDPRWRPDLTSEAAFLRNPDVLAWAWDHEPHFADFAHDVKQARRRLEDVLREGERADRIRVVCPDCDSGRRLVVQYAPARVVGYRCRSCGHEGVVSPDATHCPNRLCWTRVGPAPILTGDRRGDTWKCPACKHRFDTDAVRRAHAKQLRSAGTARWVTVADAVSILRVQGGWRDRTVRAWASDTTEVATTIRADGARLVWWPDMWRLHLLHRFDVNEAKRKAVERERRKAECARDHGADCWTYRRGCAKMLARTAAM